MSQELASSLWEARRSANRIATGDGPATVEDAYVVQGAINGVCGSDLVGFKIGATADVALETLQLTEPFYGPLFSAFNKSSGADVVVPDNYVVLLETEFVIGIGEDIKASGSEISQADIEAVTAWVAPAFELVATRFDMELPGNGVRLIADSGGNHDFVMGDKYSAWKDLDLAAHPASLFINDEEIASGHSGMSIKGHPAGMTAWLANHYTLADRGLKAGDIITTGTCTGMTPVKPGDVARADFGPMGSVTANFVKA